MHAQLRIPPSLEGDWRGRIERQLDLVLASVHWQIRRLNLVLEADTQVVGTPYGGAVYRCLLEVKLRSGRSHRLTATSRDPQACAADVAARLRREIVRDKQLGSVG